MVIYNMASFQTDQKMGWIFPMDFCTTVDPARYHPYAKHVAQEEEGNSELLRHVIA
jgi:hypothetical protein